MSHLHSDVYSTREIAHAAGVPLERVVAALGSADLLLGHDEAVRLGRSLRRGERLGPSRRPGRSFRRACDPLCINRRTQHLGS